MSSKKTLLQYMKAKRVRKRGSMNDYLWYAKPTCHTLYRTMQRIVPAVMKMTLMNLQQTFSAVIKANATALIVINECNRHLLRLIHKTHVIHFQMSSKFSNEGQLRKKTHDIIAYRCSHFASISLHMKGRERYESR